MPENKLVGIDLDEKSVEIVGQDLVGKLSAVHQGKIGSLKLTLEGKIEFIPFAHSSIDKVIDWAEKKIPGDQTVVAEGIKTTLKSLVSKIKL